MKKKQTGKQPRSAGRRGNQQPEPFTPGFTRAMVRQHAFELYRDKLAHSSLTLEDWVLAEKDLLAMRDRGELLER